MSKVCLEANSDDVLRETLQEVPGDPAARTEKSTLSCVPQTVIDSISSEGTSGCAAGSFACS